MNGSNIAQNAIEGGFWLKYIYNTIPPLQGFN